MKLSQFIDRPDMELPMDVLDRIVQYHYEPIKRISGVIDVRIHSCYRPKQHELQRGRNGNSLHTFSIDRDPKGRGAIDISSNDMQALYGLIISELEPFRIARYPWGFHCDWLHSWRGLTHFDAGFQQITKEQFIQLI